MGTTPLFVAAAKVTIVVLISVLFCFFCPLDTARNLRTEKTVGPTKQKAKQLYNSALA